MVPGFALCGYATKLWWENCESVEQPPHCHTSGIKQIAGHLDKSLLLSDYCVRKITYIVHQSIIDAELSVSLASPRRALNARTTSFPLAYKPGRPAVQWQGLDLVAFAKDCHKVPQMLCHTCSSRYTSARLWGLKLQNADGGQVLLRA